MNPYYQAPNTFHIIHVLCMTIWMFWRACVLHAITLIGKIYSMTSQYIKFEMIFGVYVWNTNTYMSQPFQLSVIASSIPISISVHSKFIHSQPCLFVSSLNFSIFFLSYFLSFHEKFSFYTTFVRLFDSHHFLFHSFEPLTESLRFFVNFFFLPFNQPHSLVELHRWWWYQCTWLSLNPFRIV